MSHIKSTALERLVIHLLGGLNRFYGIPTLALGLGVVHTRRFGKNCRIMLDISSNAKTDM